MYSEILKQYVIRTDTNVDRRKKSEEEKKKKALAREEYIAALKDFCTADDLIGVNPTTGCCIFNRYLSEYGKPETGRNTFSRMAKETFGLETKLLRTDNGFYATVFIKANDE